MCKVIRIKPVFRNICSGDEHFGTGKFECQFVFSFINKSLVLEIIFLRTHTKYVDIIPSFRYFFNGDHIVDGVINFLYNSGTAEIIPVKNYEYAIYEKRFVPGIIQFDGDGNCCRPVVPLCNTWHYCAGDGKEQ